MPTYDYRCEANGKVIEVKHSISQELHTWEELCSLAGIDAGDTPRNSPVKRLATGGNVVKKSSLGSAPPCASGPSESASARSGLVGEP